MKRPEHFPFEHKAGGLVFKIYRAPQFIAQPDGTQKEYESFLVSYYEGARRVQRRKGTWDEVDALVEDVVIAHRKQDPERLELTGTDRRIYLSAVDALKPVNMPVDLAAIDFAEATKTLKQFNLDIRQAAQLVADALTRLKGKPISTAVDFFERYGETMSETKSVPDVVQELVAHVEGNGRGVYHVRDLKNRLERFGKSFPGPIHNIKEKDLSGWLQGLLKCVYRNGKLVENQQGIKVESRTRNNYRNAIHELFAFACKRGYLPKGLPTAASETVPAKEKTKRVKIIPPADAVRLLKALPPKLIPYTATKLFSGVRTKEGFLLHWEDLQLDSGEVMAVDAEKSKVNFRRVPKIPKNLKQWLAPFKGLKGPINRDYSNEGALQAAVLRCARKAGLKIPRNAFRHCYISYRVAQPTAPEIVAEEAGTSTAKIKSNYKSLATEKEAAQWFSIMPNASQVATLKRLAREIKGRPKAEPV